MKDDGGPAFPIIFQEFPNGDRQWPLPGMSLRDYFAAAVLQGKFANSQDAVQDFNGQWEGYKGGVPEEYKDAANEIYLIADAMLEARKKCPIP